MKKLTLLKLSLASLFFLFLNACDKTNDAGGCPSCPPPPPGTPSFEVTYTIDPVRNCFTRILYNDENESAVYAPDLSGFYNGTKRITVSAENFTARIAVVIMNNTMEPLTIHLGILVDGKQKQSVEVTAPPLTQSTLASASYYVQSK